MGRDVQQVLFAAITISAYAKPLEQMRISFQFRFVQTFPKIGEPTVDENISTCLLPREAINQQTPMVKPSDKQLGTAL